MQLIADDPVAKLVDDQQTPPQLVVVFQARPSTGDAELLAQLQADLPLAGVAVVLGSWCEGETRTGKPVTQAERLFWYQFPAWWQQVRTRWSSGQHTHWQHPTGQVVADSHMLTGKLVAVSTAEFETAHTLIDTIEDLGGHGVWQPRSRTQTLTSNVAGGVWVGGQLDATEEETLAEFRRTLPEQAPLVVLLDFPRCDRVAAAKQLGATTVLGKPWRADQLAASFAEG